MLEMNDSRANELTKQLEGEAKQDDSQAWWPSDNNYLMDFSGDTTPEATAYALKLLNRTDAASPLLPKAAVYLVNHRSQGYYWESTEQTAMVIYGLTDYLERTQELKPNYSVDVQVNGKTVATKKFTAADALAPATTVTLNESQLAPGTNQVRIAKSGDGRLYWSTRGEYYSSESKVVNTGSFKLSVARQYYRLTPQQKDGRVVYHLDKLAGPVQVGDTLAVRITVGGNDWRYLMIEDPIPSGTESIARDDLYELDEQPDWWAPLVQQSRAARRSHHLLQHVLPARAARIRVPAEGGESRRLPREPDQRAADVSAGVSLDQRRVDGDGEMTAKHSGVAKLWLLNLVGNAALLAAVYFWLLMPDAHGWQVAARRWLAVVVIFFGLWLRTGTFAYFRVAEFRDNATVWRAFRHALRHMIALAIWAIVCLAGDGVAAGRLRKYAPQFGVWFWQKAPAFCASAARKQVFHAADWLLWFLLWVLVPAVWLPIASTVAAAGFRLKRMARSLRVLRRPAYWLWFCALMLVGAYVPYKLVWWIPDLSDLRKQAWSMGLRFFLAYVILISAWVALLLVVGTRVEKEDPEIDCAAS